MTEAMEALNADVLKALVKRLGLPKGLTRKADLSHAVEHYLDTNLEAFLNQLSWPRAVVSRGGGPQWWKRIDQSFRSETSG